VLTDDGKRMLANFLQEAPGAEDGSTSVARPR
jgi:hypothetical protein